MDARAAKLALARKKLRDHQDKKLSSSKSGLDVNNEPNQGYSTEHYTNSQNPNPIDEEVCQEKCSIYEDPPKVQQITNMTEFIPEANVTEILISSKRKLESQICDLQSQLSLMEANYNIAVDNNKSANQKIQHLESVLEGLNCKFLDATKELMAKEELIKDLNNLKAKLCEENTNYQEQLEFTKTVLSAKDAENSSLHSQLYNLQQRYESTVLQLQQMTTGSLAQLPDNNGSVEQIGILKQKIHELEMQQKTLQKERDQLNSHYVHYTNEINEQFRFVVKKNEELTNEIQNLSNRENSLIDQISDMEIRLQSYAANKTSSSNDNVTDEADHERLLTEFNKVQEELQNLNTKYAELQNLYSISIERIKELEVKEDQELKISLTKLNADIASDKVAAQIATEQNKKLKEDMQKLEQAFVKMSKDKLELTEKLTAEKYLNRELTLKLADIEEKAKENEMKLKAKDGEMIRLQAYCRDTEAKYEELVKQQHSQIDENTSDVNSNEIISKESSSPKGLGVLDSHNTESAEEKVDLELENGNKFDKEDAMNKLQNRFLKIMEEVAALSDEKHRLEHIILQLQNETDTICEYVALYQQQRSLLKRRDEERSAQLKIFQTECERLRNQLEELTNILLRFVEDKALSSYFEAESKRIDKEKVMSLLSTLKTNSLIDPTQNTLDFKAFYPCNCCSGKLIEV